MLLQDLDTSLYNHRRYLVSDGDAFSERKALEFEEALAMKAKETGSPDGSFDIKIVPRARKIHQTLLTALWSSLRCCWACVNVLRAGAPRSSQVQAAKGQSLPRFPDLILANGPATATILIASAILCRFLALKGSRNAMRTIYVESWARVKELSLSGKLLRRLGLCERILVQWPDLAEVTSRHPGRLEFQGAFVS